MPEGVLGESEESVLFALEVNEITTFTTGSAVFIYEVLEKSVGHEVAEDHRDTLGRAAYLDWLIEKQSSVEVVNEFDIQTGDADKLNYVIIHANLN